MLLLAELIHREENWIQARACVREGNPFLSSEGLLHRCALVEMMAQAFAAGAGAQAVHNREKPASRGYLASLRNIDFFADARVGEELFVRARPTMQVGNVVVVDGEVHNSSQCLCKGQFKIFMVPAELSVEEG